VVRIGWGKKQLNATTNPFQASAALSGNLQYDKRERFKKVFLAVLAAHVLLFLFLLIQESRGNHSANLLPSESMAAIAQN
jgi:hypothetical protein